MQAISIAMVIREEVDEEYRANHEMELMLADLLPKADIAAVGLCEEEISKPFVEDLHETAEERARLEAEKDEILRQLSKDVDFDLSRARKIGPNSVCGRLRHRFRCATGSTRIGAASQGVCQGMCP